MAYSNVSICNMALSHIGQRSINSLTQDTNEARKCNLIFELARDTVLRSAAWGFSTVEQALALIDGEELAGWDYVYARPANCLFVRKVYNASSVNNSVPASYKEYKASNGQLAIACDVETASAEFTLAVTDPNDFDPSFVESLSYKIAAMVAKPLTGDMKLMDAMNTMYQNTVKDARAISLSETYRKDNYVSSYLSAR